MDLGLSEFQRLLQGSARDYFEREMTFDTLKAIDAAEHRHHRGVWGQIAANGWPGLLLPEDAGGVAAGAVDLGVLLEEFGRAAVNSPFRSAVFASAVVAASASSPARDALLARIATGECFFTVALQEPGTGYRRYGVTTNAVRSGEGFVLSGTKAITPYAGAADGMLVLTRVDGAPAVLIVPAGTPGLSMRHRNTVGGEPVYHLAFDGVELPAGAWLGFAGDTEGILDRIIDLAVLMVCAETVGLIGEMLRATAAHVSQRVQFGRPIGTFQAVHCRVADMATLSDGARLVTFEALEAWDRGDSWQREAAVAKAFVSEAAVAVSWDAHLLHGGIGLTTESRLPYYTRKAKANQLTLGTEQDHLAKLSNLLLGVA